MAAQSSGRDSTAGGGLPPSVIAKCAGVDPNRRGKWARHKPSLVRPGPGLTAHDAIETAILARLAQANQKVAPRAWLAVRQDVRKLALAGVDDIWIALSETGYSHLAVDGAAAAAESAAVTGEAYRFVPVRERIVAARQQFDVEAARLRAKEAARRDTRQRGRA